MFGSKLNEEVSVFISGQQLSGIETFDISYSNSSSIIKPLGTSKGVTATASPSEQKVSFSRYLIYDDPILDYTGESNMSGSINYDSNSYGFESGYLLNYSVNCAVGNVPRVNADFFVLDEFVTGSKDASGSVAHPSIDIPSQGSISITCDKSTTNRVLGFDYSLTCERIGHYTIGSNNAVDVELVPPVSYKASVQIEIDDSFLQNGYSFLQNRENKTVSFNINGRGGNSIQSLSIPQASLVSENLSMSSQGSLQLTLNYIGHGF